MIASSAISLIATIAAKDTLKGAYRRPLRPDDRRQLAQNHIYATPRGTFGFLEALRRHPAHSCACRPLRRVRGLRLHRDRSILSDEGRARMKVRGWGQTIGGAAIALKRWWHVVWTSLIGLLIGVVPPARARRSHPSWPTSSSKTFSKTPGSFTGRGTRRRPDRLPKPGTTAVTARLRLFRFCPRHSPGRRDRRPSCSPCSSSTACNIWGHGFQCFGRPIFAFGDDHGDVSLPTSS